MSQESRPIAHAIVWVVAEGLDGLEHDKADPLPAKPFDNYANREEIFGSAAAATYPMHMNWEERPIESFADGAWFTRQAGKTEMGIWFKYLPTSTFSDPFVDAARYVIQADTLPFRAAVLGYPTGGMTHFAPSLDVSVVFHRLAPASTWLYAESFAPVATNGLMGARTTIWSETGQMLVTSCQQMLCRRIPDSAR